MAKKVTLNDIASMLTKQSNEIHDLTESVEHVVKSVGTMEEKMATKDQVLALQVQVNSIEGQLKETRIEVRLGNLEEKVFGSPRR